MTICIHRRGQAVKTKTFDGVKISAIDLAALHGYNGKMNLRSTRAPAAAAFAICLLPFFGPSPASAAETIMKGIVLPPVDDQGKWEMTGEDVSINNATYLVQRWRWQSEKNTSGVDLAVKANFKKQVPPPEAPEVARAIARAASRASYASDVSDKTIAPGEQWVEFRYPEQGVKGFIKIISVADGTVTLTGELPIGTDPPKEWKLLEDAVISSKIKKEGNAEAQQE